MTNTDLRSLTVQAIRLLLLGELQPRQASALVQLCNLHRVIQTADHETRLAKLEQKMLQENESPLEHDSIVAEMGATQAVAGPDAEEGSEEQSACSADACSSDRQRR